jgi:hypothetical protein
MMEVNDLMNTNSTGCQFYKCLMEEVAYEFLWGTGEAPGIPV